MGMASSPPLANFKHGHVRNRIRHLTPIDTEESAYGQRFPYKISRIGAGLTAATISAIIQRGFDLCEEYDDKAKGKWGQGTACLWGRWYPLSGNRR